MKHLIIVLTVFVLMLNISYSQYKYENPIYVKNNTSSALTNAQVLIRFNTLTPVVWGWMQADGKDIAFTSACGATNYLQHWIDSYMLTDSTKIWVRVPYIGANDSALFFLNFGNPNATNLSTFNVFDGPWSSTDSVIVSSTNGQNNHQFGFRFSTNNDLLVTHFGKRVPDSTQRYITLFDFNSQAIIAQSMVSEGNPGQYNYNLLTTPIWLLAGRQFIICAFCGYSQSYFYGQSQQVSPYITYIEMRHMPFCSQNTFPTISYTGYHYGCPDFLYWAKQNVSPAPTFSILPSADTVTPAAPQNLTATLGALQVLLKWNKNSEYDISKYNVYMNTEFNPSTSTLIGTVNQPDTTFLVTGLTSGTTYFFWVKSVDRYCNPKISPYSNVAICVPGNATYNLPELIYYKFKNNIYNPLQTPNFASTPVGGYYASIFGNAIGAGGEFDSCVVGYGMTGAYVCSNWAWNLLNGYWTISFWVKDLVDSGAVYLFGDNWTGYPMMRCYYGGGAGTNNIYFRGPSWDIIVPCQMPGPQVFHFVSNGSQILIYTNGVLTGSYGPAINITQGLVFNVAGYTDFVSGIRGKMDEFRLYNRALSSNEISQTWNQELPVTLQVQPPPAPILISPVNGGTADVTSFCWHSLPTALHYTLQVSNTPSFTNLIINASNLIDTMYSVSNGLFAGNTTYYWRVNASNQGGDGPWSTIWSFTMMQHLPLSLKLYLEGFWNGATEIQDTVKVYLAQSASPYTLKDSAKIIPATDGTMSAIFTKANNGNYYLVIKHRNHLETWSMLPQAFATSIPVIYDFTTDSSKAYGFNMKKVGTFWALFVGDPNQDGSIDGIDISIFETQYGLTGPYMSCDFNGDGSVDAMDVQFIPPNFGLTKSTPAMVLKSNPVINTKNVPDNSKVKPKVKSETSDVKGEKKDKKK